jgi:protein TonB
VQGLGEIANAADQSGIAEAILPAESALVLLDVPRERRRRRILVFGAALVSLSLHAGALLAAIGWADRVRRQGAITQPSDAISVELVASTTLDSLQEERVVEPKAAPDATAPVKGSSEPSRMADGKPDALPDKEAVERDTVTAVKHAVKDDESRAPEKGVPVEQPLPAVPAVASAEAEREQARADSVALDLQVTPKEAEQNKKQKAMRSVQKGGTPSKATSGKGTGSARVSASTGSILSYAAQVRARVAGNRPSWGSGGGTALVAFGLTSSGGLAYVRIARSSGNAANDSIALSAVRGAAPFPPPPAGASLHQLQFTIPYYFR